MKKNQDNDRVRIGSNFKKQPRWKKVIAIFLIYMPIITTLPFVIIGVFLVRAHIKYIGGSNIKSYWDFVPSKDSYRYSIKNQITVKKSLFPLEKYKWFWIFNCNMYCTYNIALYAYMAYLIRIVENWWCPFAHNKRDATDSFIDKSCWHIYPDRLQMLHPEDRENPLWNEDAEKQNEH